MGDWVNITFSLKPTLVDEAFLNKLDACFAEVGYRPSVMWIPQSPKKDKFNPSERLEAMNQAGFWKSHNPYDSTDEWLQSAHIGYSASGENDWTTFHVYFLIWKINRYVSHFTLKTHVTSLYFSSDCAIEEDEPDDLKEDTRKCMAKAETTRRIVPIIHEKFGCYYTNGTTERGPLFIIATAKKHILPFFDGKEVDTAWLFEMPDGKWICPVCDEAHFEKPLWFLSSKPETPWAEPSFQKCPTCHTQYGVDDNILTFPNVNQGSVWGKLQRKWLKQKNEIPPP
jgi:hypothetical protein